MIAAKSHDIDEARLRAAEAEQRYEALGRPVDALQTHHLAAVVSARVGDWRPVLDEAERVREELLRLGRTAEWAQCTVGWAAALSESGEKDAAIRALNAALAVLPHYATLERAQLLHNRGNSRRLTDPEGALEDYLSAERIFAELGVEAGVATCKEHRGALASRAGDKETARRLIEEAVTVLDSGGDRVGAIKARHNLATVVTGEDPDLALSLSLRAVADTESERYRLGRVGDRSSWVLRQIAPIYGFALHQCLRAGDASGVAALAEVLRAHSLPAPAPATMDPEAWPLAHPSRIAVSSNAMSVGAGDDLSTITEAARRVGGDDAWWLGLITAGDRLV